MSFFSSTKNWTSALKQAMESVESKIDNILEAPLDPINTDINVEKASVYNETLHNSESKETVLFVNKNAHKEADEPEEAVQDKELLKPPLFKMAPVSGVLNSV